MRRLIMALAAALLLIVLGGCGNTGDREEKQGYEFVDALGRTVIVDDPQRVLALMGGFAETWQLAGGELAGVTKDAVAERGLPLLPDVAIVGEYNNPNIEAILAMEPDFVLLSAETPAHVALQEILDQAGISAAYFSVTHFDDYLAMLDICTRITGRDDLYQQNGIEVEREIKEILSGWVGNEEPTVLLLITHSGGAVAQDAESMTGRMLDELGCVNLTDLDPSLLNEFSIEHIMASDPDYIFVIPMGNDEQAVMKNLQQGLEGHPSWNSLTAVQEGRYICLPKELFLYKPNAGWAKSYTFLRDCLDG